MGESFGENQVGSPIQGCPGAPPEYDSPHENPNSHWIEIELRDETSGEPIPGEEYRITLPDGTDVRGYLDDKGCAGVSGIKSPGGCKITFPAIDKNCWRPA